MSRALGSVKVLDEDPDLAAEIPLEERSHAIEAAVALGGTLPLAGIDLASPPARLTEPGGLGVLVLDGLASVELATEGREQRELLGPGDLIRPWLELQTEAGWVGSVGFRPLTAVRVAILDRAFAARCAPWPQITSALVERLVLRTRRMALQTLIARLPRAEERVERTLWLYAERWGRVTPAGVVLELPVSHEALGAMVGLRRPSTTSAISRLRECGRLRRQGDQWLLPHAAHAGAVPPARAQTP